MRKQASIRPPDRTQQTPALESCHAEIGRLRSESSKSSGQAQAHVLELRNELRRAAEQGKKLEAENRRMSEGGQEVQRLRDELHRARAETEDVLKRRDSGQEEIERLRDELHRARAETADAHRGQEEIHRLRDDLQRARAETADVARRSSGPPPPPLCSLSRACRLWRPWRSCSRPAPSAGFPATSPRG